MRVWIRGIALVVLATFAGGVFAKTCKTGQPCGNSCISWSYTCHIGTTTSSTATTTTVKYPPTASFSVSQASAVAPATIAVDAGNSYALGGVIGTFQWATSDGQTASGKTPSLVFSQPGTYTITLTVTDGAGLTGTSQQTITVTQPKPAVTDQSKPAQLVRVVDGDTISIMVNAQKVTLRLNQIDAPEKSQAFGSAASACLSDILKSGALSYIDKGKDKYGRTIAQIYAGSVDVNKEMVSHGCAWAYTDYVTDQTYFTLQAQAKAAGLGLWASGSPTAPWDYRHGTTTPAYERVLNWAEFTYSDKLVDGTETKSGDGVLYRCYAGNFCVGVKDSTVYIYDGKNVTPVGDLSGYSVVADQQGF